MRVTAKFSQDRFRATYVQENKRDDKVREEVILQGMAQVQAYDGRPPGRLIRLVAAKTRR